MRNKTFMGKEVYSEVTNHLLISSVMGSNNITVAPPFLALHLDGVRKSLVQCLFLVMSTARHTSDLTCKNAVLVLPFEREPG